MTKKTEKKGVIADKKDYTVELKYSPKAERDQLIKFTAKKGNSFEVSAPQMIELVSQYVNGQDLEPVFVDTERIKVVYVERQMEAVLDRDFKAGEKIRLNYKHPYPLEFAIIEEAYNIAKIDSSRPGFEVTPELMKQVKRNTPQKSKTFIEKFYQAFKNLSLGRKT
jgi:hypothetical protein